MIPICWAFSEKKTEAAYDAIFSFFSQHLAPHMQPILVTMDFEVALGNAISTAYPDARICRCYFHYLQVRILIIKNITTNSFISCDSDLFSV